MQSSVVDVISDGEDADGVHLCPLCSYVTRDGVSCLQRHVESQHFLHDASGDARDNTTDARRKREWASLARDDALMAYQKSQRPRTYDTTEVEETAGVSPALSKVTDGIRLHGRTEPMAQLAAALRKSPSTSRAYITSMPILHIRQPTEWSCGYANFQALCTGLRQLDEYRSIMNNHCAVRDPSPSTLDQDAVNGVQDGTGAEASANHDADEAEQKMKLDEDDEDDFAWLHASDDDVLNEQNSGIPHVYQAQQWIEEAWRHGYDPLGASQLDYQVVDTEKWIGATEVAVLFLAMGIE